jgi:hypothetical protein
VIELPEPMDVPEPQPPSYHLKLPPEGKVPPTWVKVVERPDFRQPATDEVTPVGAVAQEFTV